MKLEVSRKKLETCAPDEGGNGKSHLKLEACAKVDGGSGRIDL